MLERLVNKILKIRENILLLQKGKGPYYQTLDNNKCFIIILIQFVIWLPLRLSIILIMWIIFVSNYFFMKDDSHQAAPINNENTTNIIDNESDLNVNKDLEKDEPKMDLDVQNNIISQFQQMDSDTQNNLIGQFQQIDSDTIYNIISQFKQNQDLPDIIRYFFNLKNFLLINCSRETVGQIADNFDLRNNPNLRNIIDEVLNSYKETGSYEFYPTENELAYSIYENQRYVTTWSNEFLPSDDPNTTWSNKKGAEIPPPEETQPPVPELAWDGNWQIFKSNKSDSEGWMYASSFSSPFHNKCQSNDFVRRRIWVRQFKKNEDFILT